MNTRSFLLPRLRAVLIGWLPASAILGMVVVVDGVSFGYVVGQLQLSQALYLGGLVAAAGIVISPVLGIAVGLPLFLVSERFGSQVSSIGLGAAVGSVFPFIALGVNQQAVALAIVLALVGGVCSWLSCVALRRDLGCQHAT